MGKTPYLPEDILFKSCMYDKNLLWGSQTRTGHFPLPFSEINVGKFYILIASVLKRPVITVTWGFLQIKFKSAPRSPTIFRNKTFKTLLKVPLNYGFCFGQWECFARTVTSQTRWWQITSKLLHWCFDTSWSVKKTNTKTGFVKYPCTQIPIYPL